MVLQKNDKGDVVREAYEKRDGEKGLDNDDDVSFLA